MSELKGPEDTPVAMLASCYPRAVDTAVRNEVVVLRELGHVVHTFAIRRAGEEELTSDFHREEAKRTFYILSDHKWQAPLALLSALFTPKLDAWAGLKLAWQTRAPGLKAAFLQLAYWVEACILARELSDRGVRHLHVHIGENSASVAMLASAVSGVPYSMTIHGPYIFRAPEKWALGTKIERSKFTLCITEFTRSQCMVHVEAKHWERMPIIHCAPEPGFLKRQTTPLAENGRFVWVGRICEEKAVPVLLEAASKVADEGYDFELVMIGDGPLREASEALIRSRGLEDRIRILGWQGTKRIADELERSTAMVLPSFAEGLPAVIMEAFALERPCISTYIAGIPELVEPGRNGWLVPAGSAEALAGAMRELLDTPVERLREMGAAGRADVLERHDAHKEVALLSDWIRRD